MKTTSVLVACLLLLGWAPLASADTLDCAIGTNAAQGSISCTFRCDVNQTWRIRVDAHNNGGFVKGQQTCGGAIGTCPPAVDKCTGVGGTTSSHSHTGDCFGEQYAGDLLGLSVQCTLETGTWTTGANLPWNGCDTTACFVEMIKSLEQAVAGMLDGPVAEYHLISLGGAAFGFACTAGATSCIQMPATCTRSAGTEACWI